MSIEEKIKNAAEADAESASTKKTPEKKIFESHKNNIAIFALYVVFIGALVIGVCRLIHLIAPSHLCWMTAAQIQSIDSILTSGLVGGLIGRYANKLLEYKE